MAVRHAEVIEEREELIEDLRAGVVEVIEAEVTLLSLPHFVLPSNTINLPCLDFGSELKFLNYLKN